MTCTNTPFISLLFYPHHTLPHQEVAAGEHSRGGRLLEEPKMMLFRGNTFSLQVSIQDVPQLLWSIKPFTTCQVSSASAMSAPKLLRPASAPNFKKPAGLYRRSVAKLRTFIFSPASIRKPSLISYPSTSKLKDSSKGTAGDHQDWLSHTYTLTPTHTHIAL